jgi:uncharacterized protein YndB with AHSA1/START domain
MTNSATSTAASTRSLVIEKEFPHPPEKVWRALTESSLIQQWLMENDFQPVVGHRFNFRSTPMPQWNGIVDCQVLDVDAPRKLSYTWGTSGAEAANGLQLVVTWTLTPTSDGVHVRMEQTGFGPDQENNYRGATYGWNKFIGQLETVVAGLE